MTEEGETKFSSDRIIPSEWALQQLNLALKIAVNIIENQIGDITNSNDVEKLLILVDGLKRICNSYNRVKKRR